MSDYRPTVSGSPIIGYSPMTKAEVRTLRRLFTGDAAASFGMASAFVIASFLAIREFIRGVNIGADLLFLICLLAAFQHFARFTYKRARELFADLSCRYVAVTESGLRLAVRSRHAFTTDGSIEQVLEATGNVEPLRRLRVRDRAQNVSLVGHVEERRFFPWEANVLQRYVRRRNLLAFHLGEIGFLLYFAAAYNVPFSSWWGWGLVLSPILLVVALLVFLTGMDFRQDVKRGMATVVITEGARIDFLSQSKWVLAENGIPHVRFVRWKPSYAEQCSARSVRNGELEPAEEVQA